MEFRSSHKCGGRVISLLLWLTVLTLSTGSVVGYPEDEEDYCSRRPGQTCCPGRDDYCTMPILDTVCYCDMFCNRTQTDCCPDFMAFCVGVQTIRRTTTPASSAGKDACYHEGRKYSAGQSYPFNCNNCTCQRSNWNNDHSFVCTERPCVIREQVIDHVNKGSYGWRASNYSFFWGMALDDGVRYRLGTKRPTAPVRQMNPLRVRATDALPDAFDWRTKLPQAVQPIMDQGDCGSSWAFSSASVASDRLAVQSQLHYRAVLSPQQILSCNRDHAQQGCNGGYIDRAWWYMWKVGVVEDKCYPYKSGQTRDAGSCKIARGVLQTASASTTNSVNCPSGGNLLTSRVFQASPLYRIPPNEREIMKEIMDNGPVQAILEVKEDLYMYQSGVYRHSMPASSLPPNHLPTGFHSVKIVGWGEEQIDGHRVKYWICANSWGPNWGENGYFRIVRGTNECEIESFIVGVWARVNGKSVAAIARQLSRKYRAVTHHRSDAMLTSSNKSQSKPRNKTAKQTS